MAVNPKLILIASELAGNEKVRKTLLYILFFSLGLIMLIFIVFIGLISGLLSTGQRSAKPLELLSDQHFRGFRRYRGRDKFRCEKRGLRLHAGVLCEPFQSHYRE